MRNGKETVTQLMWITKSVLNLFRRRVIRKAAGTSCVLEPQSLLCQPSLHLGLCNLHLQFFVTRHFILFNLFYHILTTVYKALFNNNICKWVPSKKKLLLGGIVLFDHSRKLKKPDYPNWKNRVTYPLRKSCFNITAILFSWNFYINFPFREFLGLFEVQYYFQAAVKLTWL